MSDEHGTIPRLPGAHASALHPNIQVRGSNTNNDERARAVARARNIIAMPHMFAPDDLCLAQWLLRALNLPETP